MIERNDNGDFVAACDYCVHGEYDTGERDFLSAVREVKRAGWRVFKNRDGWQHKCDGCVKEEEEDFT